MPYDEFVRLQLAGDEARPDDPDAFIATGFNRCYPDMVDANDQRLRRQNALDDITETTGLVFLGLTVSCVIHTAISSTRYRKLTITGFRRSSPVRTVLHRPLPHKPQGACGRLLARADRVGA